VSWQTIEAHPVIHRLTSSTVRTNGHPFHCSTNRHRRLTSKAETDPNFVQRLHRTALLVGRIDAICLVSIDDPASNDSVVFSSMPEFGIVETWDH
jgi:hypothetical protein